MSVSARGNQRKPFSESLRVHELGSVLICKVIYSSGGKKEIEVQRSAEAWFRQFRDSFGRRLGGGREVVLASKKVKVTGQDAIGTPSASHSQEFDHRYM